MKKYPFGIGLAMFIAAPLAAHDFWIQPQRFQAQPGTAFPGTFQVGHAEYRQRWNLGSDHIVLINDVSSRGVRDIRSDLTGKGNTDFVTRFSTPGIHLLVMQSTFARSELPAIRFNDYAAAEGLRLVLAERKRTGSTNTSGRERYNRRGKALIQVGGQSAGNQALATRPVGLKLEIVPERNPYDLDSSRILPVHVLYKGRRLAGATVKLTSLEFDAKPVGQGITDREGRVRFRVPPVGDWLVNVIWSEPVKGDPTADFETNFSSLTFGYDPAQRPR